LLLISGRADKRQLVGQARHEYGSNLGFSQRRAAWARQCLVDDESLAIDATRAVALATGPENADNDENRLVLFHAL